MLKEQCGRQEKKDCKEPEDQGAYHEIVSPSKVRSYTHQVSPTWLLKSELNKNSTNEQAKMDP